MEMSDISLMSISWALWGMFLIEFASFALTIIGSLYDDDNDDKL